eukprot:Skav209127  [mRNA]  locus=scaffold682:139730:142047:+ [translate_table: standard]
MGCLGGTAAEALQAAPRGTAPRRPKEEMLPELRARSQPAKHCERRRHGAVPVDGGSWRVMAGHGGSWRVMAEDRSFCRSSSRTSLASRAPSSASTSNLLRLGPDLENGASAAPRPVQKE